jgi:hypothetical protein
MNSRTYVYDQLFLSTIGNPIVDKTKFVGMFVAECFIQSKNHSRSSDEVRILLELMNFVLIYQDINVLRKLYLQMFREMLPEKSKSRHCVKNTA